MASHVLYTRAAVRMCTVDLHAIIVGTVRQDYIMFYFSVVCFSHSISVCYLDRLLLNLFMLFRIKI